MSERAHILRAESSTEFKGKNLRCSWKTTEGTSVPINRCGFAWTWYWGPNDRRFYHNINTREPCWIRPNALLVQYAPSHGGQPTPSESQQVMHNGNCGSPLTECWRQTEVNYSQRLVWRTQEANLFRDATCLNTQIQNNPEHLYSTFWVCSTRVYHSDELFANTPQGEWECYPQIAARELRLRGNGLP